MKVTYILANGERTLATIVKELEEYIQFNEEWEQNPSEENHSFSAEAYGARDILEFIRSDATRHEIASDGSIAKLEKTNGVFTVKLEGSRGSLVSSRTYGINSVLADMSRDGAVKRTEYRTAMPILMPNELWNSEDPELIERLETMGYTANEYLELAKERIEYEEAFLKHAFSVWAYGGLTIEYTHLSVRGVDLLRSNNKDEWTLADNANIEGIDAITHNGHIDSNVNSPLNMTQYEAEFIVKHNKKRIMSYIRGRADWNDEPYIAVEE